MQIWRLRSGADKRFRSGHPWVYSNELAESPKGLEPGAAVELRDASDKFLARGYGNPASLIAFRALTRDAAVEDPFSRAHLVRTLSQAARVREAAGLFPFSHRLCFGEADRLPGLVIDRFRLVQGGQVFVLQAHAAGADRMLRALPEALEELCEREEKGSWAGASLVLRNDLGVRKLEGLAEEEPRVLREAQGARLRDASAARLEDARIRVARASGDGALEFAADLVGGQKTGFFLDQFANVQLAALRFRGLRPGRGASALRVLDLCCYVGQWGAQSARAFRDAGLAVEVTAVDASAKALAFAKRNVEAQGARCETLRADALKDLGQLPDQGFDLVISDPPALIQGRKDLPQGQHAYLQLNTQVFRLARRGGAVVSCSCSGLLEEEDFLKALSKAAYRNRAGVRWVARGSQSADHPMSLEFPEGRYLKSWFGLIEGE